MFDPRTELSSHHAGTFDLAGRINDRGGAKNFGSRARKTAQNYENYRIWNGEGVQFRPENIEDESGVCSPPLWKTSPPRSDPLPPRQHQNNYRYLSPTSRTQAVARGQWELMEMVKNMPESSYELSLKDLVEHQRPRLENQEVSLLVEERSFGNGMVVNQRAMKAKRRQESKKNEKKAKMMRSGSFDNGGLFLKMVFPFSFGSKKKKNSVTNSSCANAKVSPKPEATDKSSKGLDKEWWKRRFSVSGESESGGATGSETTGRSGSSGSSGSSSSTRSTSSSRKRSGFLPGCWPFFRSKESESAK